MNATKYMKGGIRMKSTKIIGAVLGAVLLLSPSGAPAQSAGSAFTYQGQLKEGGLPADGAYDFQFTLYDDLGVVVGGPISVEDHPVTNGLFSAILDFGAGSFTGDARFLEISVRPGDSGGAFTTLSPRQELTPTPYATTALTTVGVDGHSLDAVDGSPADAVYVDTSGKVRMEEGGLTVFDAVGHGIWLTSDSFQFDEGTSEEPIYDYLSTTDTHRFWTNGTRRMVIDAAGNVGIGTDSPSHQLHIAGEAGFEQDAWFHSQIPFEIAHDSNTGLLIDPGNPSLHLEVDNDNIMTLFDGAVGIGTSNPTEKLEVDGTIKTSGLRIGNSATAGHVLTADASGVGTWQPGGSGGSLWTVGGAGIYYDAGYVAVGHSSPSYPLHVADWTGVPTIVGDNRTEDTRGHLGSDLGGVYGESGQSWGKGVYGLATVSTQPNYGVYGKSNSSNGHGVYGEVTGSGGYGVYGYAFNGIGVHGEATGPYGTGVSGYTASPTGSAVHAHNEGGSGNAIAVWGETGSPDGFGGYFSGKGYFSGDVGIGTESPTEKLDVAGTAKMQGFQLSTAPAAGYVLTSDPNGVGTWQLGGSGSSPWSLAGTTVYYEGGKVGVGTSTPVARFHVVNPSELAITAECIGDATTGSLASEYAGVEGYGPWLGVKGQAASPTGAAYGGYFTSASDDGYGVWGHNESAGVFNYQAVGVYGSSDSTKGVGVKGYVPGPQGAAVWGRAAGTNSRAVYAQATATSGVTYGLEAYAGSPDGYGVYAVNEAETGNAIAVRGETNSPSGFAGYFNGQGYFSSSVGIGTTTPAHPLHVVGGADPVVLAESTSLVDFTSALAGQTGANQGRAVYGHATAATGNATGGYFETDSTEGHAVRGKADASTGVAIGGSFSVKAPDAKAVVGDNNATSGSGVGVYGSSDSDTGKAVLGVAWDSEGVNYAVYGQTISSDGFGGYFDGKGYFSGNVGIGVVPDTASLKVHRASDMDPGYAIEGTATANSGISVGVRGQSLSPDGRGLEGVNLTGGWAGYFQGQTYVSARLGIRTENPTEPLDIDGTAKMTGFRLTTAPSPGYVLTSDANGVGTWQESTVFELPYDGTVSDGGAAFAVTNTGTGTNTEAIHAAVPHATSGASVAGYFTAAGGVGRAVWAVADTNHAIVAYNSAASNATILAQNNGGGDIFRGFAGTDPVFRVTNDGTTETNVLQINGGSDLSEQFDVQASQVEPEPGMVVCIDPANPGKLIVSTRAYDRKVAGIVSGAGGVQPGMLMGQKGSVADGKHPVALTGRVYVWADASSGAIEPGDLLTTSDVPGHAMKVNDYGQAQGAIIGKAMTALDEGRGLVLVLVSLQ